MSSPPSPVVSPTGIIHVLGYSPAEGEQGAPISVRIHFRPDFAEEIYVRLVVGTKPVPTTVREIHDVHYGRWQLDAVAPPLESLDTKVLVSVQALNNDNTILDTATFGEFSYWVPDPAPKKPKLRIHTATSSSFRRRGASQSISSPSPSRLRSASHVHLHRRSKHDSLIRPKGSDSHLETPILDIITPLQDICLDWSPTETAVARRLVRFTKVQDGRRLIVSCEPIKADDYCDNDSVISCIYREESDLCYVTSVDIIFLLERLTDSDFPVEEKNRIRRNLEGLRPTTVSKHKHGFEDFFQRIMEFPDPKPRNIEKDLKVFEWSLLDQALDKILSKYTVDTSTIPVEDPDSESSTGSEEADYEQPVVHAAILHEEFPYMASPDESELCSPMDTSFQLYDPASSSVTGEWPDYKAVDYPAYDVTQPYSDVAYETFPAYWS